MAENYLNNANNLTLDYSSRVTALCHYVEFSLKCQYYLKYPNANLQGHISKKLITDFSDRLHTNPPQEIIDAAMNMAPHYNASRYPENTSYQFGCQLNCTDATSFYDYATLDTLFKNASTIIDWLDSL